MTLRVGLAGAGMVSRHHLLAWQRAPDATVVALADPDGAAARRRAEEFAIPSFVADVEAMLGEGIDALDIAASLDAHRPLVEAAVRHGVPILCQKPLAATAHEAADLGAYAARRGVRLMVHENWRFRPHYRTIHEWLRVGTIGPVRAFHLETLGSGLLPKDGGPPPALTRQPFLARMERLIVLELLVHHLDTLAFLLGPVDLVAARTLRLCQHVVGEDTASLTLAAGSAAGTVFASMAAAGAPAQGEDRLQILGETGRITLSSDELVLHGPAPKQVRVDRAADYQAAYDGAIAHFVEALATGEPFETPPDVHVRALELVEATYRAAAAR